MKTFISIVILLFLLGGFLISDTLAPVREFLGDVIKWILSVAMFLCVIYTITKLAEK
jgi:hypothetical protein